MMMPNPLPFFDRLPDMLVNRIRVQAELRREANPDFYTPIYEQPAIRHIPVPKLKVVKR